eukprot:jgi/Tetstr1/433909/TSEL_023089.t1
MTLLRAHVGLAGDSSLPTSQPEVEWPKQNEAWNRLGGGPGSADTAVPFLQPPGDALLEWALLHTSIREEQLGAHACGDLGGDAGGAALELSDEEQSSRHESNLAFLKRCCEEEELGAVIVGDVKPTWGGQWGSLCMFQGGCAHLGIPGISAGQVLHCIESYTQEVTPQLWIVSLGSADEILNDEQAGNFLAIVQSIVQAVKDSSCDSRLLLVGRRLTAPSTQTIARTITSSLSDMAKAMAAVDYVDCSSVETEEALPGCIAAELWQLASAAIPPMEMNDSGKQAMNAGKRSSAAQPYQWSYSKWSACSAPCGDGVQQREAQCVDSATGYVVADEQCYLRQDARLTSPCSLGACPTYQWVPGPWGSCDAKCDGGVSNRTLSCVSSRGELVNVTQCDPMLIPPSIQHCNLQPCARPQCFSDAECPRQSSCRIEHNGDDGALPDKETLESDSSGSAGGAPVCSSGCGIYNPYLGQLQQEGLTREELEPYVTPQRYSNGTVMQELIAPFRTKRYHTYVDEGDFLDVMWRGGGICYRRCRQWYRRRCEIWENDDPESGNCLQKECSGFQGCHDVWDYFIPSLTECTAAKLCSPGTCVCEDGFKGPTCGTQIASEDAVCGDGVMLPTGSCCESGKVAADGTCCPAWAEVDANGRCCASGRLDACGVCDGSAVVVDALGSCCPGELDAAMICCEAEGGVDDCGVCGGSGASCLVEIGLSLAAANMSAMQATLGLRLEQGLAAALAGMGVVGSDLRLEDVSLRARSDPGGVKATGTAVDSVDTAPATTTASTHLGGGPPIDNMIRANVRLALTTPNDYPMSAQDVHRTLSAYLASSPGLEKITAVRRRGICGNGICEVGEMGVGAMLYDPRDALLEAGHANLSAPNFAVVDARVGAPRAGDKANGPLVCPEDCPLLQLQSDLSGGMQSVLGQGGARACGGHGVPIPVTGGCECYRGYAGANCTDCDLGHQKRPGGSICLPVLGVGAPAGGPDSAESLRWKDVTGTDQNWAGNSKYVVLLATVGALGALAGIMTAVWAARAAHAAHAERPSETSTRAGNRPSIGPRPSRKCDSSTTKNFTAYDNPVGLRVDTAGVDGRSDPAPPDIRPMNMPVGAAGVEPPPGATPAPRRTGSSDASGLWRRTTSDIESRVATDDILWPPVDPPADDCNSREHEQ